MYGLYKEMLPLAASLFLLLSSCGLSHLENAHYHGMDEVIGRDGYTNFDAGVDAGIDELIGRDCDNNIIAGINAGMGDNQ